jgi:hypothetical protein
MNSDLVDGQFAQQDERFDEMSCVLQMILLRLDEIPTKTPKLDNVNVLPSVSNPASETSQLSDHECDLPPVPPLKSHMLLTCVKPASPSKFSGDHVKGCTFLNSCKLYIRLTANQFPDDKLKVLWAFSFMKGGCTAHFVDCKMCMYHVVGSLNYSTWHEFTQGFMEEFCPKNKSRHLERISRW